MVTLKEVVPIDTQRVGEVSLDGIAKPSAGPKPGHSIRHLLRIFLANFPKTPSLLIPGLKRPWRGEAGHFREVQLT